MWVHYTDTNFRIVQLSGLNFVEPQNAYSIDYLTIMSYVVELNFWLSVIAHGETVQN